MLRIKNKDLLKVKKELIAKQDNRCAICGIWFGEYPMKDICVDHDHDTGEIRSALCRNCNRIEGKIKTLCISAKRLGTYKELLAKLLNYWTSDKYVTGLLHPTHTTDAEKADIRRQKARQAYARSKAKTNHK